MSRRRFFLLFSAIVGWFGRDGTRKAQPLGPQYFDFTSLHDSIDRAVWLNYKTGEKVVVR